MTSYPDESCRAAAERMAEAGVKRLPVVAPDDPGRLLGIVSLGDLLQARQRLLDEESKREQFYGPKRLLTTPPPIERAPSGKGLAQQPEHAQRSVTCFAGRNCDEKTCRTIPSRSMT